MGKNGEDFPDSFFNQELAAHFKLFVMCFYIGWLNLNN